VYVYVCMYACALETYKHISPSCQQPSYNAKTYAMYAYAHVHVHVYVCMYACALETYKHISPSCQQPSYNAETYAMYAYTHVYVYVCMYACALRQTNTSHQAASNQVTTQKLMLNGDVSPEPKKTYKKS
jgi:hypothetical protein